MIITEKEYSKPTLDVKNNDTIINIKAAQYV